MNSSEKRSKIELPLTLSPSTGVVKLTKDRLWLTPVSAPPAKPRWPMRTEILTLVPHSKFTCISCSGAYRRIGNEHWHALSMDAPEDVRFLVESEIESAALDTIV